MKNDGWIVLLVIIVLFALLGSCSKSEYEETGDTFSSWIRKYSSTWADTQTYYFNNFMELADEN